MPVGYDDAIRACLTDPEFLREYDRLRGTSFSKPGSIENQIDRATGKYDEDAKELAFFIRDYIWLPVASRREKANGQDDHQP